MRPTPKIVAALVLVLVIAPKGHADKGDFVDLAGMDAWKPPIEGWSTVGGVGLDPKDPKALKAEAGSGVIVNGPTGKALNLISKQEFGDVELHLEFVVPRGSNSGVKFQAVYEVQIFDSFGSTRKPTGRDCGGVYPRSEEKPKYHQIDDGFAPRLNACKPPGEWQDLDVTFLAPRFDAAGKKVANARISARLNGQVVQDNLDVPYPTGSAWHDQEKSTGPILIQGDHGPVAYRNIRLRKLATGP